MATPIPVDKKRCQAEITRYTPYVMGGPTRQTVQCSNKPTMIATETEPGPDGRRGSMSLCDDCRKQFDKRMPAGFATFTKITRKK